MPCAGPVVGCPPREAALPPCGTLILMHITISALPLARLDRTEFSFQSCRLPDYFIGFNFSLQPCHLPEYQARQHTPGSTALGKHATESLLSLPQLGAVQGRQPVQVHSLQAQQRQALDPNNKRHNLAAGLPSSSHDGILDHARCYSRSFIPVLPQRACHARQV